MIDKMITEHHTHGRGYIILPIGMDEFQLPPSIEAEGLTLILKEEVHISLVSLKSILPVIRETNGEVEESHLVQDFLDFQQKEELSKYRLLNELRFVEREERRTVVVMAEVVGLEELFGHYRAKYGVDIPTQPAHATLYTLQPEVAIGINSRAELETISRPVEVPEIKFF